MKTTFEILKEWFESHDGVVLSDGVSIGFEYTSGFSLQELADYLDGLVYTKVGWE